MSDDGSVTTDTDPVRRRSAPSPGAGPTHAPAAALGPGVGGVRVGRRARVHRGAGLRRPVVLRAHPVDDPDADARRPHPGGQARLTIHRGDIVVFNNPPADDGGPPTLVKRVIGLPGETISSVGNTVLINGKPLAEPWLPTLIGICAEPSEHINTTKIAPGHYFMMGDCRGDSDDSRYWGTVPASYIVGKVDVIIWRNGHPWIHWF